MNARLIFGAAVYSYSHSIVYYFNARGEAEEYPGGLTTETVNFKKGGCVL